MEYYDNMKQKLNDVMIEMNITNTSELLSPSLQQANKLNMYIRINEIKTDILTGLKEDNSKSNNILDFNKN